MPSSAWDHFSDSPGEYLISADVFISNSAGTSLRKVYHNRSDYPYLTGVFHDLRLNLGNLRRKILLARIRSIKVLAFTKMVHDQYSSPDAEKSCSNWLFAQKSINTAGHWRPATCRLTEEGERCLLNIYVDVRSHLHLHTGQLFDMFSS